LDADHPGNLESFARCFTHLISQLYEKTSLLQTLIAGKEVWKEKITNLNLI
jgi:hypothetical protein